MTGAAAPAGRQLQAATPADQQVQTDLTASLPNSAAPFQVAQASNAYPASNKAGTGTDVNVTVQSRFGRTGNTALVQPNQPESQLRCTSCFPASVGP